MIFIIKGQLEKNVPVISQIMISIDRGIKTSIICTTCDDKLFNKLTNIGVKIYCTDHKPYGVSILRKISDWVLFKRATLRILKGIHIDNELLYIGSVDTVLSIGKEILNYKYILHIRELYDKFPLYLKFMRIYAQEAKETIIPEYCRANILKNWLDLKKSPIVIPNKPFEHMRVRKLEIDDSKIAHIIDNIEDKKIILYQGLIDIDRNLCQIAEALSKINNNEYVMVLMGTKNSDMVEQVRAIYPNTVHIDFVPAPFHLQVTSYGYIGIVNYDDSSLNNMFCAPNKIYEYSGFGMPTLGRDIPGIRYSIGNHKAGVCVDFDNVDNIVKGLREIENNYEFYSKKSTEFFDDTDLGFLFDKLVSK
ncbi:MAG: hypothetical protein ACQEWW_19005 [Bacillota bacterium]